MNDDPEVDPTMAETTPARPRWHGAVAGLVSGAVAVTVGMLVAGIIEVVSPIDAVGSTFIDHVPAWLKDLAIRWFGTNDKIALRVGIVVILGFAAIAVGIVADHRPWFGVGGIALFGLVGLLAAVSRPAEPGSAFLPSLLGALVGAWLIYRLARGEWAGPLATPHRSAVPLGWDRRRFLAVSGAAGATAVAAGFAAQALERNRVQHIRNEIPRALPAAAVAPGPATLPTATSVELDPATPYFTPNADFYRIDTALSFPRIDIDSWRVEIAGMVAEKLSLSYAELSALPQVQRVVTLTCVSNDVGGDLVGNATWQGVLLKDLLQQAGVDPAGEQVYSTSLDGWSSGFPLSVALDGRDAMIAIGMNGQPLPLEHGFPARLVVPGLYGYVSGTKWLRKIEINRWSDAQGFWVPLGWSRDGPIKTQSRIDVPRRGDTVAAGAAKIAGVAWAQHRGVDTVEVRIDSGEWRPATLSQDAADDAWRQWVIDWDAVPGKHTLQVRATDKTGAVQVEKVTSPAPDGATGYHTRTVTVR
ncbi:MAG: molybdopterin-dependent oxidoreductase [Ilumatobacteraceae bacterium]